MSHFACCPCGQKPIPARVSTALTRKAQPAQQLPKAPTSLRHRGLDTRGDPVELGPRGVIPVLGPEPQAEAVTLEPGEDVQMDVKDFLSRSIAVGQEEVHSFASQTASPEPRRQARSRLKDLAADRWVEVREASRVRPGNYEHVPGVDRLNVMSSCIPALIFRATTAKQSVRSFRETRLTG
jgi:hypothetical protein